MKVTCQQICILTSTKKKSEINHKPFISEEWPPKTWHSIFINQCLTQNPTPTKDPSRDFFSHRHLYYFTSKIRTCLVMEADTSSAGWRRRGFIILISFLIKRCSLRAHYITTPGDGVVAPLLPHVIVCTLDILFSSNRNIHKSSCGLYFWASDPLIERF